MKTVGNQSTRTTRRDYNVIEDDDHRTAIDELTNGAIRYMSPTEIRKLNVELVERLEQEELKKSLTKAVDRQCEEHYVADPYRLLYYITMFKIMQEQGMTCKEASKKMFEAIHQDNTKEAAQLLINELVNSLEAVLEAA